MLAVKSVCAPSSEAQLSEGASGAAVDVGIIGDIGGEGVVGTGTAI